MKKRMTLGGILIALSLAYALFNSKINGALVGTNVSPTILGIAFLGIFILGLYFTFSSRKK